MISLVIFYFVSVSCVLSDECVSTSYTGRICGDKRFQPEDLLNALTYDPIDISFVKLIANTSLTVPSTLGINKYHNAVYKKFSIIDSCVTEIQEDFFRILDRNNTMLDEIVFGNVSCLRKLHTNVLRGVGDFIKILTFELMPDLNEIGYSFFDTLRVLERLTIVNTRVWTLPDVMLTAMPRLLLLKLNNNQLTMLPWIPRERTELLSKIQAFNNPFHCQCSLQLYIDAMKSVLYPDKYRCATPQYFKDQALIDVPLCDAQATTTTETQRETTMSTANIRMQTIIIISVVVVVVVIIIIVVVISKRHAENKKEKRTSNELKSPSKIIFQNQAESKEPFIFKYQS